MSCFISWETATTASHDSKPSFSIHELSSYPAPSCSFFHGRSGSGEGTVATGLHPYLFFPGAPARLLAPPARVRGQDVRVDGIGDHVHVEGEDVERLRHLRVGGGEGADARPVPPHPERKVRRRAGLKRSDVHLDALRESE